MQLTFGPFEATLETRQGGAQSGPVTLQDLNTRYQRFNARYFQGKLPMVAIRFANLPGETAGLTTFTGMKQGDKQWLKPGSLAISINDMFRSPHVHYGVEGSVDTILLHEMTHVLMASQGLFSEKHGTHFRDMLRRLASATGFSYDDLMGKQQAAESQDIDRLQQLAGIRG